MKSARSLIMVIVVCAVAQAHAADGLRGGKIQGKVIDTGSAMTLPMASVRTANREAVFADLDGRYGLDLPPGTYDLTFAFTGYKDTIVRGVTVTPGQVVTLDVPMALSTVAFSEEVTVTAEGAAAASQAAQLLERKKAGSISDAVGAEEMRGNADSDAASAMQRVTGLSVVDGQYVFVRGLGERYSNTMLNGAILPTTEPDRRVVPLDLFPTGLVESLKVTKSYLPDKPAEFSGGLVEIEPINFPRRPTLSFALSGGWNSNATFRDVHHYPGGATDWLGFDDGSRALPGGIPGEKLARAGVFGSGFSAEELEQFGEAFSNVWEPRSATGRPDSSLSVLAGNSWRRFGGVVSATYNYRGGYREERQQVYVLDGAEGALRSISDYDFRFSTARATIGVVANAAYHLSSNHHLSLENFYTHSAKDETRTFEGYQDDKGVDLRNTRLFWLEEGILSSKLSGEHFLPRLSNSRVDWRVSYSMASRDEPDLRETLYEFNPAIGEFILANESQSGLRMFTALDDRAWQGDLDWNVFFRAPGNRMTSAKVGGSYVHRTRDFSSRRFRLKPVSVSGVDLTQSPEDLFGPGNIGTVFEIGEDTRRTDAYEARHDVAAGYAMLDVPVTSRLRFVGGARVESSDQSVDTFDLFDPTLGPIRASLVNTDVLPGLNLVFTAGSDMNVRAAYSHTVNRPDFRELAPYEFTDVVGGRAVVGNPDLVRALIRSVDLRWEWFPRNGGQAGEVVAVSVFLKDFDRPIERVIEATASIRTSYDNALGAFNRGVELEARKAFGARTLFGVNYTYVKSEIDLDRSAGRVQTSLHRPLAGQSPHVLNGMFEYTLAPQLSARVLVNWFDDRISDVGAFGIPDIIEEGRVTLDAVLVKRLGRYSLRLSAENLTDAESRFTQGGLPQRTFRNGRLVELGVSYAR